MVRVSIPGRDFIVLLSLFVIEFFTEILLYKKIEIKRTQSGLCGNGVPSGMAFSIPKERKFTSGQASAV